jgi:hypothetical protein
LGNVASRQEAGYFEILDTEFVRFVSQIKGEIPGSYLNHFRMFFKDNSENYEIFDANLHLSDFPRKVSKRGASGDRVESILAKAYSRTALVHVLNIAEKAATDGELKLGSYVFLHLSLNIFCRPDSYRRLTLSDFRIDRDPTSGVLNYFLDVLPAKSRVRSPTKIVYRLNPDVGKLLSLQREAVVKRYGHLAPPIEGDESKRDLGRIALFPATRLKEGGQAWSSDYSNKRFGMLPRSGFVRSYISRVSNISGVQLSCNALRHTIGTQLAMMGCSSSTIQAVLKHGSDTSAKSYVDIAFEGVIDELSESLQPAFEEFFPAFNYLVSVDSGLPEERRIESEDLASGRVGTTGFCGREVACQYAPLACYECHKFIPCFDADHSINIAIVDAEIRRYEGRGRAMEHEIERWKNIRGKICLIKDICEKRTSSKSGAVS